MWRRPHVVRIIITKTKPLSNQNGNRTEGSPIITSDVKNKIGRISIRHNKEKCDVTLPWWQHFWITTKRSLSNDDGDNAKEKSNRFRLAKQQLCTCSTLFWTFLSRHCTTASGMEWMNKFSFFFVFLDTVVPDWTPDNFAPFDKFNITNLW